MKVITFAVPCYNSEAYMEHCIHTLLTGGDEVEILLIDDGSTDRTGEIADEYQRRYPSIVRAIHQENGGHGEGVNTGLRNAVGVYYKVVDSDDWADTESLKEVVETLRRLIAQGRGPDLFICNYVYEHAEDNSEHAVRYTNVLPQDRIFTWEDIGRFRPSQYLLMHSVFYRTQLLRDCGLVLPKHTFYVDNIFVYQPLPWVKTMYYMDLDFYRYFIGRSDQSVNEQVMVRRVDQQVRVTRIMIDSHDLREVALKAGNRLARYMFSYLCMMMVISSIFLTISGTPESLGKKTELWEYLRTKDSALYHHMKYRSIGLVAHLPGYGGRKASVSLYRVARKIYKFN
ncbi:Glycosyltransferase involved in cell wall bisynthesis [Papillibacter cinnamivorans DSM 12816]|uniref:Glycosyltransferase involved in cell wall bisynthesis n=2 Tax=Papillibacter TaxID=100175 RepID=A0A1W2BUH1_9FIRM|nr:glycosyltransferase family 2 protein [Papillibacter cinnamivorans]SMC76531.1 Glycosyltransferase involved in cell wall bisynthesis [Papillibacter cinnamivorans DSM 12816]